QPLFNADDLKDGLEKQAADLMKAPRRLEAMYAFLRAVYAVEDRAGDWRLQINNEEKNRRGVFAAILPEKADAYILRNPGDKALFLVTAKNAKAEGDDRLTRRLYTLDGT